MTITPEGIKEATEMELFHDWLNDADMQKIFPFSEYLIRMKNAGVRIVVCDPNAKFEPCLFMGEEK